jgi:uncharacterized membrane protein YoaT (DUF817 family)
MHGIISVAILAAVVVATEHWFGPIGVTRLFGLLFVAGAMYGCVAPSFTVSLGSSEVVRLTRWKKLFAVVPTAVAGLFIALFAPEITCVSTKYKYLCA